jgi:hypothetical protein
LTSRSAQGLCSTPFGTTNISPADRYLDRAVAKIDPQNAVENNERLIGVFVIMPDKVALQLHDLELVVVHFGDDLWLPLLVEQPELLAKVDGCIIHVALPRMMV